MPVISKLEIIDYAPYKCFLYESKPDYIASYVKTVRHPDGRKRYHINVHHWRVPKGQYAPAYIPDDGLDSVVARNQFTLKNGLTVNFEVYVESDTTIEEVERMFEDFFVKMECQDYS